MIRLQDLEQAVRNQHVDVVAWKDLSSSIFVDQAVELRKKRVQESRARGDNKRTDHNFLKMIIFFKKSENN